MKMISQMLMLLFAPVALSCATGTDSGYELKPAVQVILKDFDAQSVTFKVNTLNAEGYYIELLAANKKAPTAAQLQKNGLKSSEKTFVFEGLDSKTSYAAYACAYDGKGNLSSVVKTNASTGKGAAELYSWEENRTEKPRYCNMALCYGGSDHRSPFKWNQDRFQTHVSYKDADGKEHWLFDAFLAIEFVMTQSNMSLNIGQGRPSGTKESWQELMDYWFEPNYGFDALNKAVGATAERIGKPATTRKVVMVIPDPIPYYIHTDTSSETAYWGKIGDYKLDFARDSDRIMAMEWFIDQVRERWNRAGYNNLEFIGFYCVSEDLAVNPDAADNRLFWEDCKKNWCGWSPNIKRWENIYPEINNYIHSCNETMNWIPYYKAAGFQFWKDFVKMDYAQMQPNYFWGYAGHKDYKGIPYSLDEFKKAVLENGLSMELEMDDAMLESTAGSDVYRARVREYMQLAKDLGLYGTKEFSYYMGGNTFYKLAKLQTAEDHKIYLELCEFIAKHYEQLK